MGLFNNYSKPGPGVSKDAPRKKGIFLYMELFTRKFSKLIALNFLYFVCSLPMIILYFVIFALSLPNLFSVIFQHSSLPMEDMALIQLLLSLVLAVTCTITLGTGPASASLAYVLREYSKEEHVWLWSTFLEKMKENFKQEMLVAVIDLVFVFVSFFAISFYFNQYLITGSALWLFMAILLLVFSAIFVLMHYYIHQLIVTFDNKLRHILKNSLLFVMSTLFQCVLLSAFVLGTIYAVFNYLTMISPIFSIIVLAIILISFLRFPIEFYVHSAIKRILKIEEKDEIANEEEVVFQDLHGSEK